ncbi:MAG: hypothetical protein LBI87_09815 [Candidatus Accumulibacter sp.]|jgi:hypothetical protein|nr:hypothetical protein [Accumulibacter sp.]
MKPVALIGIAAVAALAGCASQYADAPTPTRWETSRQHKLTAAEHWRRIADHFAAQLTADLRGKGAGSPLYAPVDENGEFPFVEGFRELLTTALVRQGLDVRTRPGDGVQTVAVRYSVYRFDPARAQNTRYYGEATALAAGLVAIGGVVSGGASFSSLGGASPASVAAKTVGSIGMLEGLGWAWREGLHGQDASGVTPQSEIILTASVTQDERIVTRYSGLYYVADEDVALYWKRYGKGAGTQLRVKGEEQ